MGTFRRIKAALIGSGAISEKYLTNITKKFHVIDMVGCSDLIPERSAQRAEQFGIRQMTNEEILSDPTIEIVVNTTYPLSHYEVTKAALLAGKHVYTEKMLAVTLEEGLELCELAKEKGLMLTTAPDTFLGGGWQTARHMIDTGLIGTPIGALGVCIRSYQDHGDTYTEPKSFIFGGGGGIPFDMGGYDLHTLFNIFGPIESVCGYAYTRNAHRPYLNPRHEKFNEDFFVNTINTMCASMKFKAGPLLSFTTSSEYSISDSMLMIMGTEGILYLPDTNDFSGTIYLQKKDNEKLEFPLCHPFTENCRGIGAADMAWALRTGRKSRLSFEMSYHTLEVINAVIDSSNDGETKHLTTDFDIPKPISTEFYRGTSEERSLFLY